MQIDLRTPHNAIIASDIPLSDLIYYLPTSPDLGLNQIARLINKIKLTVDSHEPIKIPSTDIYVYAHTETICQHCATHYHFDPNASDQLCPSCEDDQIKNSCWHNQQDYDSNYFSIQEEDDFYNV